MDMFYAKLVGKYTSPMDPMGSICTYKYKITSLVYQKPSVSKPLCKNWGRLEPLYGAPSLQPQFPVQTEIETPKTNGPN